MYLNIKKLIAPEILLVRVVEPDFFISLFLTSLILLSGCVNKPQKEE